MTPRRYTFDEANDRIDSLVATIKQRLSEAKDYDNRNLLNLRLGTVYDARDAARELEDTILGLVYGRG